MATGHVYVYMYTTFWRNLVLEREPGSGSIYFSAYGWIAPTHRLSRLTCVSVCLVLFERIPTLFLKIVCYFPRYGLADIKA